MPHLDQLTLNQPFATLGEPFFSRTQPEGLPSPQLLHVNAAAAALIGLAADDIMNDPDAADILCGNRLPASAQPIATLYAGHQFGYYVPQLGDGRALSIGVTQHPLHGTQELQFKGSGRTPFSRSGDGRAVLRSSVREYLCSEAMHGLRIPTTRALSLVGSSLPVFRETTETAAVIVRVAPGFVRFGHFETFYYRKQTDQLRALADYVLAQHYPELVGAEPPYIALLQEVSRRTALLMAQWQAVGFTHGVMNTDNMSILGLTLDYGPFGFLDHYEPGFVCNHSDEMGRYAFDQQPDIAGWNLSRLAQALSPLTGEAEAYAALQDYPRQFASAYINLMSAKLGLPAQKENVSIILSLLELLHRNHIDYTIFLRRLCDFDPAAEASNAPLRDLFANRADFDAWANDYRTLLLRHPNPNRPAEMRQENPKFILRNYLAENAIRIVRDDGDTTEIDRLLTVLHQPFDEHPALEHYAAPPPDWAKDLSLSCSS